MKRKAIEIYGDATLCVARLTALFVTPVQASCLNPNKCKRPAYINHFTKSEKRHAIIGIRQRDADSGLDSSGTLEPAEGGFLG
jgi:hypothetical protein